MEEEKTTEVAPEPEKPRLHGDERDLVYWGAEIVKQIEEMKK